MLRVLLSDPLATNRRFAIEAVQWLKDECFTADLARATRDPSENVRWQSVTALVALKSPAGFAAVRAALTDPSSRVKKAALELLGVDPSRETLEAALHVMDPDPYFPLNEVRSLAAQKDGWRLLVPFLQDARALVRVRAIHAMSELRHADLAQVILAMDREASADVRAERLSHLAMHPGPAFTAALVAGMKDPEPEVRARAVVGISRRPEPQARTALRSATRDGHPLVRLTALAALSPCRPKRGGVFAIMSSGAGPSRPCRIDDPMICSVFLAALGEPDDRTSEVARSGVALCMQTQRQSLLSRFGQAAPSIRLQFLRLLDLWQVPVDEPFALVAVEDRDPEVREVAQRLVSRLGRDLVVLRRWMSHPSANVKRAALLGAGPHLGDAGIAREVRNHSRGANAALREAAIETLVLSPGQYPSSQLDRLLGPTGLKDRTIAVRRFAVKWYADQIPQADGLRLARALGPLLADPDPGVRAAAVEKLCRRWDPRIEPAVLPRVADPDRHVAEKAVRCLKRSRSPRAFEAVFQRLLTGPERLGWPRPVLPEPHSVYSGDCEGRPTPTTDALLEALVRIDPARAAERLAAYLEEGRHPDRHTVAEILGRRPSRRAREALVRSVSASSRWWEREATATALGRLSDRLAIPALEAAAGQDRSLEVKVAAVLALLPFREPRHLWLALEVIQAWRARRYDPNPPQEILDALGRRCSTDDLATLARFEEHPDLAADAVVRLQPCGIVAVPLLERMVRSSNRPGQESALTALAALGPEGRRIVERALADPDGLRRATALRALGRLAIERYPARVAEALTSPEPLVRMQAVTLLDDVLEARTRASLPPALEPLLLRLRSDPLPGIREATQRLPPPRR